MSRSLWFAAYILSAFLLSILVQGRKHSTQKHVTISEQMGRQGLCVIGCTPYVDLTVPEDGIMKYNALVNEMAQTCDMIVHLGDTVPGGMPCNYSLIPKALKIVRKKAAKNNKIALYAPGDNEICDCHRVGSSSHPRPADIYKAADARQFLITNLGIDSPTDLTKNFKADNHVIDKILPGTNRTFSCDFDKYVALDYYSVATLEVPGSYWYLEDDRQSGYPNQNTVDPLQGRLSLFLNARTCALDWIDQSAAKANATGKRALFFMLQAKFYTNYGASSITNNGIGEYYDTANLENMTQVLTGESISDPYSDLFAKFTNIALEYPEMMFYVVNADGHEFQTVRMNPALNNRPGYLYSNHNLVLHMVEGSSRALTMYTRFFVDPDKFQPVGVKEEWSRAAYELDPYGHAFVPYQP